MQRCTCTASFLLFPSLLAFLHFYRGIVPDGEAGIGSR